MAQQIRSVRPNGPTNVRVAKCDQSGTEIEDQENYSFRSRFNRKRF